MLQAYAAAFFAIPLLRWFINQRRNAAIEARNVARQEWAAELSRPSPDLRAKLAAARQLSKRTVIREADIVYRWASSAGGNNKLVFGLCYIIRMVLVMRMAC